MPYSCGFEKKYNTIALNNPIVFVYVGRISYAKGVHYLLNAFKDLKRTDYKLILVGQNFDNFNFDKTDKNIEYLGYKSHNELANILSESDINITASLFDGFALTVLEGFAFNLPVICTTNVGIKDYIIEGKNGFVVEAFNSNCIKEKVEFLLNNKDKLRQMKENILNSKNLLTQENYQINLLNIINKITKEEKDEK